MIAAEEKSVASNARGEMVCSCAQASSVKNAMMHFRLVRQSKKIEIVFALRRVYDCVLLGERKSCHLDILRDFQNISNSRT